MADLGRSSVTSLSLSLICAARVIAESYSQRSYTTEPTWRANQNVAMPPTVSTMNRGPHKRINKRRRRLYSFGLFIRGAFPSLYQSGQNPDKDPGSCVVELAPQAADKHFDRCRVGFFDSGVHGFH